MPATLIFRERVAVQRLAVEEDTKSSWKSSLNPACVTSSGAAKLFATRVAGMRPATSACSLGLQHKDILTASFLYIVTCRDLDSYFFHHSASLIFATITIDMVSRLLIFTRSLCKKSFTLYIP